MARCAAVVACLFVLSVGSAQEKAEPKKEVKPVQKAVIRPAVIRPAVVVNGPVVALNQERGDWFESWVFGGMSAAAARTRLENTASQRVMLLKNQCQLTEEQVAKLELAKRGDIARFFQKVETVRREVGPKQPDRNNMQELSKAISPVQRVWNTGLISDDSLFVSVLKTTLTQEQKAALVIEEQRQRKDRNRYHSMAMIKMLERSIPLTDQQRQSFLQILVEQSSELRVDTSLEQYVAIAAAMKLSDETLSDFLDASQLKTFRELRNHWAMSMPFLNQIAIKRSIPKDEEWLNVLR